jgi:drug/metabolite transporter (DMT)-like permease
VALEAEIDQLTNRSSGPVSAADAPSVHALAAAHAQPCSIQRVTGSPAPWRRNDRLIGLALVVVSAFGFGSGALFAKPVYAAGVDWMTLLYWRFLIGAAISWAWLVMVPGNRASLRLLTRRNALILLALGAFYVGNSGTYFAALETVPASLAALIVYLYPALVAVLSLRFVRRLRGRRAWLALAISTLGVVLAVGGIAPGTAPPLFGIALTVASPVIYAVWIILAARLSGERGDRELAGGDGGGARATPIPPQDAETLATPSQTAPAPTAALMMTATAAVYLVAMLGSGRSISPGSVPGSAWFGLLGVAVASTAVAVQAFYAGARRIGAAQAALVSTVEPIYTITLATILLHDTLAPIQILGGILIIGGVILAQTAPANDAAAAATAVRIGAGEAG